jgi:hypothetical protein
VTVSPFALKTTWDLPTLGSLTAPGVQFFKAAPKLLATATTREVTLPTLKARPTPSLQIKAIELVDFTGLSLRVLGEILGTTHPTLSSLLRGHSTDLSRRPEVLDRIEALHSVAKRLHMLSGTPKSVGETLMTRVEGRAIADLAISGEPARAYLAALRLLAPRSEGRFKPDFATREAGTATVALSD